MQKEKGRRINPTHVRIWLYKRRNGECTLCTFRLFTQFGNALCGGCWAIHRTMLRSLSATSGGFRTHSRGTRHIIPVAEIQLQHFLQSLVTFSSEIAQMNQYEGLLHSQWADHMLQILKVKENNSPGKHSHKAKDVNVAYSLYRWAPLFPFCNSSWVAPVNSALSW